MVVNAGLWECCKSSTLDFVLRFCIVLLSAQEESALPGSVANVGLSGTNGQSIYWMIQKLSST